MCLFEFRYIRQVTKNKQKTICWQQMGLNYFFATKSGFSVVLTVSMWSWLSMERKIRSTILLVCIWNILVKKQRTKQNNVLATNGSELFLGNKKGVFSGADSCNVILVVHREKYKEYYFVCLYLKYICQATKDKTK